MPVTKRFAWYLCSLMAILLCTSLSQAQVIKGKIIDTETGKPIPNANIYLNGTYLGTASDSTGNFTLTTGIKTNTPLVVSFVGYEMQTITNYADKILTIALKRKLNDLKEVTITGFDGMSREKEMKIFLTEFIGSTNKDCVISNPDDIRFHYNNKTEVLTATVDNPLLINNKKLGYKLTYFLANFSYAPLSTVYRGNYFFAEDTAGVGQEEIKNILKARDEAYFGSRMHFIRSLWSDELAKNNFEILQPIISFPNRAEYDDKQSKKLFYKDVVGIQNDSRFHDQKFIELKTEMINQRSKQKQETSQVSIIYKKNKHKEETSYLKQEKDYLGTLIDSNGFYGEGLGWNGDMGISRVNKLLPFEFQPQKLLD